MRSSSPLSANSVTPAAWVALAPHELDHAEWHFFQVDSAGTATHGLLNVVINRLPQGATVALVVPLTRCIVMAVDLPPLQGAKMQQALAGVLSDRLTGSGGAQHYAAAPADKGRIREAAACDAGWLKKCMDALADGGLRVVQVLPEASLLPKAAAWWGQLPGDATPAWLMRTANGETLRASAALLDAVLPAANDAQHAAWQWFADAAISPAPPALPGGSYRPLNAAALLRGAAADGTQWDLRQFAFAPPDGAARLMQRCADITRSRSGRFVLWALAALVVVNVAGLNLYAMKQKRAMVERHAEMERIATQALPGVPRLLEPAVQLESVWARTRGASASSEAATLLGVFAQTGNGQALATIELTERGLRATYSDRAALERSVAACDGAALREVMQRANVRCTRDGERLLLDFAAPKPKG